MMVKALPWDSTTGVTTTTMAPTIWPVVALQEPQPLPQVQQPVVLSSQPSQYVNSLSNAAPLKPVSTTVTR